MTASKTRLVHLPALACTALVAASAASAADGTSYEMSVYTDHRSGVQVLAGDYDSAIDAARRGTAAVGTLGRLVLSTNLCVAYTMKRAFPQAADACDEAVRLTSRAKGGMRSSAETAMIARALTNRGVLRVLSGDTAEAAVDFARAAGFAATWSAASRNLAHLEESLAYRDTLARAVDR